MRVLGISAYYHDSAAALLRDGHVLAAAQEERFTRKKHDSEFPHHAIRSCLESTGTRASEIDVVAFYDKPFLKFERLLETYIAFAPKGFASFRKALPLWVKDKLFQRTTILKELQALDESQDWEKKLIFSEHHLSHAASAFYPSPFQRAAVLTLDGVGEWTTTSLAIGDGRELRVTNEIHFPHSLGLLYSAFTYYTGFKVNSGEYKVMGLAPYGEPKYVDLIRDNIIDIKEDGTFRLNMEYFEYCTGLTMTNEKFDQLFGGPARKAEQRLTQREMDLAASVQAITEEIMLKLAGVHLEAGVVGERRVKQADRVREVDLVRDVQLAPVADRERGGGPLAHAVHGQHRGALERRGIERARRVAQVVLGEDQLRLPVLVAQLLQLLEDGGALEQLVLHPQRQRLAERGEALGREREVGLEQPLELQERLVVEGDDVDVLRPRAGGREARLDRVVREAVVVLLAREALLLRGGEHLPVAQERRGAVVVVGGNAEDAHRLRTGCR